MRKKSIVQTYSLYDCSKRWIHIMFNQNVAVLRYQLTLLLHPFPTFFMERVIRSSSKMLKNLSLVLHFIALYKLPKRVYMFILCTDIFFFLLTQRILYRYVHIGKI